MQVKVYAILRPILGSDVVPVRTQPGQTIQDLIDEMITRWPELRQELVDEDGNLLSKIHIFVNGRRISYLNGVNTVIPEDAIINIFPPVGGG